ncbi:hypothetical protein [Streptomyces sp. NPDC004065]|uniref:hypothetical protein n=1 Tax=Streptomyces sp. NPDC004065 TaxID=3364689 RepID=UPI00384DEBD9
MTAQRTQRTPPQAARQPEPDAAAGTADFLATAENPGFLEIWAHSAPIRLAGYEDDLAEPHILPGID